MAAGEYIGTTYQQIMQAVADYYGRGSDAWARIYAGIGGYYSADAANVLKQVPGVSITYSNSGRVLGYSYANPFAAADSTASIINSNVQTGSYGGGSFTSSIPSTVVQNGQGQLVAQSGSRLVSSGATVATVVDRLSLAVTGVSLGTKLGKAIDSAIYSIDPEWWDTHYPTINPETWDDMATTQNGRQLIQGIFGLQGDVTTMYMDERLLAQTYMLLLQQGAYSGAMSLNIDNIDRTRLQNPSSIVGPFYPGTEASITQYASGTPIWYREVTAGAGQYFYSFPGSNNSYRIMAVSDRPGSITFKDGDPSNPSTWTSSLRSITNSGITYYFLEDIMNLSNSYVSVGPTPSNGSAGIPDIWDLAYITFNGDISSLGLDGVQNDPRAQTYIDPSLITGTTPTQVLQQLKQNYPELFDGSIYQDTPQEDGSVDRITYVPVPIPDGISTPAPVTGETSQIDPSVNPDDNTDSLIEQIIQILTHPETQPQLEPDSDTDTPDPPDTGDGDTPVVPPVTGSASSLWKIYNPSQGQIDAFGAWLWSSDFIDQIKKLFNDPMQAIIGVHKVFCSPAVGGSATIKCGYLDSGVSSNWVSNQYTHIDCGTVSLPEYFGNVFDYDPFTRVSIFLPCVGIVPLDVAEVMRSSINVKLHCDVLTGALLAEVNVTRDQAGGILYTYSGSCIVTYPVSSGTYVGAVANVVSVAASVAAGIMGTVASGGALAPAAVGATGAAVSGLSHTRTNVQHSGSFSGAAGVMGGKIPYLIITRPQTRMAKQYPVYDGVPANFTSRLGDCTGYVKVKEVHLKVPNAYESEIAEIEQLLHQGVLI